METYLPQRPTVRRWCEHGYTQAFEKTVVALADHFEILTPPEPPQMTIEEIRPAEPVPEALEAAPVIEQPKVEIARLLYVT